MDIDGLRQQLTDDDNNTVCFTRKENVRFPKSLNDLMMNLVLYVLSKYVSSPLPTLVHHCLCVFIRVLRDKFNLILQSVSFPFILI